MEREPKSRQRFTKLGAFRLSTILAALLLMNQRLVVSASPEDHAISVMTQTPAKGALGQIYIVNFFLEVCFAHRDSLKSVIRLAKVPGWSGQYQSKNSILTIETGRSGWPTIEVGNIPNGSTCAVSWVVDPNQGTASLQSFLELKTGTKLDGSRITSSPEQTVFTGFGDYDNKGTPRLILSENISANRASYQILLQVPD